MVNSVFILAFLIFNKLLAQPYENISHLQSSTDVIKYHIKIEIYFEQRTIKASNEITLIKSPFNKDFVEIDFHDNLFIEQISSKNLSLDYSRKDKKILIDVSAIKSDTVNFIINYSGKPKTLGFEGFTFFEFNNQKIVQTVNQPNYAPSWFPCDDDPADKALLEIEITNDADFVSVSNGFLFDKSEQNGRATYHFKTVYPVATNQIGIYSSDYLVKKENYTTTNGKKLDIEFYIFPKDSEKALTDLSEINDYIKTFENLFGEYPFVGEKFSISEIILTRGAIENQTMVGVGRDLFSGKKFHEEIFIHEVAHSWWGNCVGISSWKDIWLSEGFATYSEALYFEHNFGKSALVSYLERYKYEDLSGCLYEPKNLFSKTIYYKGAWVLHMIRNLLSDAVFFNFLKEYFSHYKYRTISTQEFENFLEEFSNRDFSKFFDDWVYNDNGIINCSYNFDEIDKKLKLTQNGYIFSFSLEIKIIYQDSTTEIFTVEVNSKEETFDFPSFNQIKEIIIDPDSKLLAKFQSVN